MRLAYAHQNPSLRSGLRIHRERYIKFRTFPCEKVLNANIIGEGDGT